MKNYQLLKNYIPLIAIEMHCCFDLYKVQSKLWIWQVSGQYVYACDTKPPDLNMSVCGRTGNPVMENLFDDHDVSSDTKVKLIAYFVQPGRYALLETGANRKNPSRMVTDLYPYHCTISCNNTREI